MALEKTVEHPGSKSYRIWFYAVYIFLIHVFWFFYAWHTITNMATAFKVFLFGTPYLIGFWFNKKYLFPAYFIKGKTVLYVLFSCLSFFVLYFVQSITQLDSIFNIDQLFAGFTASSLLRDMLISQITFIMFSGMGMTLSFAENWIKSSRELEDLKSEKLKAELSSLKNQLSPHFLFNTLNMVHILTKTNPPVASEVTMELAELLRYQLYSASKELVSLEEEINFMKNLLRIEKLRKRNLRLEINIDAVDTGLSIQPLILAPLVENALKHGSQQMEGSYIAASLTYKDHQLSFVISNTFVVDHSDAQREKGTGLVNLRRRLELAYEDRFRLDTEIKNNCFIAELIILGL